MLSEKLKRQFCQASCSGLFIALLASCSSPQVSQQTQAEKEVLPTVKPAETALDFIALSKSQRGTQASETLISASERYLLEEDFVSGLWLANQIEPVFSAGVEENAPTLYRIYLVQAQALFALDKTLQSLAKLEQIDELNIAKTSAYYRTLAAVQEARDFPVLSLAARLQEFPLLSENEEQSLASIWAQFQSLTPWQLSQLASEELPFANGWIRLTQFANQFGDNNDRFKRSLSQWQRLFPTHPAHVLLPNIQSTIDSQVFNYQNIAVILPLSGKQTAAGNAAQQGILAAYGNDKTSKLHFFDAETLDWSTLEETLSELSIDFVVGPLLRKHVDSYLALEQLNIPTLLLNLPHSQPLLPHQFAISMRPEDEAVQAASTLAKKDFEMPIVLMHQDPVSERIANTFIQEWQSITGEAPRLMPFSKGKKMQTMLKTALGVEQSEERIKDLNRRIKYTIKSDVRNRRDVDMIYIVGSPTQTRVLKPYVDVSISPFADAIPMFASSRSHSVKIDEGGTRDLAGLSFTEMPWLLDSKQQNKSLVSQSKSLFPQRSDSLQRIFAMGYDALGLVNKVNLMQQHSYIRHYGQVGVLQLNQSNILTRSLLWGRYQKESVTEVAMD